MLMNQGSRATAGANNLQGDDRLTYEAGIRLFELVHPQRDPDGFKKQLGGVFAVKVTEDYDSFQNQTVYKEQWRTGNNAFIEYKLADNRGTLIAYMPDDRWYHNRMILCDQPAIRPNQLLSRDLGDISGAECLIQIQCLREVVCHEVPIFDIIMPDGQKFDFFYSEDEAMAFINKKERRPVGSQSIIQEVQPYINYQKKLGKKWKKRPEVEDLIIRFKGMQYGWTSCPEFIQNYLPKIQKLINERTQAFRGMTPNTPTMDLRSAIMDVLTTLPKEQIDALRAEAERKKEEERNAMMAVPAAVELLTAPVDAGAPQATAGIHTKTELNRMRHAELAEIAKSKGIPVDGLNRLGLINAIVTVQERASTVPVMVPQEKRPEIPVLN